jgi:predicted TIM-barrel fold metal-dependent hydrolase
MQALIDTHQHLIYPDRFNYPWIAGVPALRKSFTLDDYAALTEDAGIEATLFMEVDVAETDSVEEARYFIEQAEIGQYGLCGVIASGRPEDEGFEAHLDRIESPRLRGIRRVLHTINASISQGAVFRNNIKLLGTRNLVFDLCLLPSQHFIGIQLVDACPETQFVLDHCGNPDISDPSGFDAWRKTLEQMGERPNVHAKLSGIVATGTASNIQLTTVRPYLEATLEAFGSERLVWGSDWPVCELTTDLLAWISIFREWLSQFTEEEQQAIANSNARKLYNL